MKISIIIIWLSFQCWSFIIAQSEFSIQFDGINDYVDCGVPANYSFNDLTIMCWVKTSATPLTYQGVVTKDCDGCTGDFSILAHHNNVGDITFGGDGLGQISGGQINDGAWHFVAGTRKGSTGTIKLYIDGDLIITGTGGTDPISNNEKLQFGRYLPTNPHYFEGSIDEISIWEVELTATQIQHYMSNCPIGTESGLKGYWDLEEGTGTLANDITTNNNNGVLTNEPTWNSNVPYTCGLNDVRVENGDFYIESLDKGIIMKAPNGQCWKISVNDTGMVVTELIACPD